MASSDTAEFEQFWEFADKNGDGKLDKKELKRALKQFVPPNAPKDYKPPSDKQIDNMFLALDCNNDDVITRREYINEMVKKPKRRARLAADFKKFDKDGSGFLSVDEMYMMIKASPDFQDQTDLRRLAEAIVDQCDKDKDGNISFEEFVTICNTL